MSSISHTLDTWADLLYETLSRRLILAATIIALLTAFLIRDNIADPDLFARLAMGKAIHELGYVPEKDPFAFTPKHELWIDHEWGSGLIFYAIYLLGGEQALTLSKFFGIYLTLWLLIHAHKTYAQRDSISTPLFILLCIIQSGYVWMTTVRCHLFTYLFLAYLYFALTRHQRTKSLRYLIPFPLIMLCWANLHGGFVVGLGILSLYTGVSILQDGLRPSRAVITIALLAVLATCINPYGPVRYWEYILHAVTMPRSNIPEWLPLDPLSLEATIPTICTVLILRGAAIYRGVHSRFALTALAVTVLYGYSKYRLHAIYMFTALIYGAQYIEASWSRLQILIPNLLPTARRSATFIVALLIVASTVTIIQQISRGRLTQLNYRGYPVQALTWLKTHRNGGNLLVSFNAGSYALWALPDSFKVSMDGRYEEVYPESTVLLVADALDATSKTQPKSLQKIDPDYVLTDHSLTLSTPWNKVYRDHEFTLYEKS
jgi:hypothetical protein